MAISDVTSTAAAASNAQAAVSGAQGEQRFLKLLVTQLNNQDPLNPLDNAQLTSQLAQMSTVSGIEKLNGALESLISQSGLGQVLQSAALIGRSVLVPGNSLAAPQAGSQSQFAIEPQAPADSVTVQVVDATGQVVRSMDMGTLPAGLRTLSWDGRDDAGKRVSEGNYAVRVVATSAGSPVPAGTLVFERVQSVAQGGTSVALDIGDGRYAGLGQVRLIQ